MKIQVTLKIKANTAEDSTVDLIARPSETVQSVKEKVAGAQLIPFPEQELTYDGKVLSNESKLADCGIMEGSSLSMELKATEATLAQQLVELLQSRDLSSDEVGLLYCYKHGANISQALKLLGFDGKLQDFVAKQKSLSMNNGQMSIARKDAALKPFSPVDEVVQILNASDSGVMDIKELCAAFVQKFGASLSSIVGSRPVEFFAKEKKTFTVRMQGNRSLVSLQGVKRRSQASSRSVSPPGLESAAPPGLGGDAPPGLGGDAPPGLGGDAPPGLGDDAPPGLGCNSPPGLSSDSEGSADVDEVKTIDAQQFMELHTRIHSRSTKLTHKLNDLVAALSDTSFLDIDHVVIGGSVGKGTAITGCAAAAEVVLFLNALPMMVLEAWRTPLLNAVAGSMAEDFKVAHGIESISVTEDSLKMCLKSPNAMEVKLYLSPAFESYMTTVQVLSEQGPDARKLYHPSFAKERAMFVARQPSSVKVTIRLIKWWRDQQEWYGLLSRPSDELLELVSIYSAVQTKPADQKEAIANLMSLLSRFDKLKVVWSNYYSKDDVWTPLLRQRPLLMDPTNPYVNVADTQTFEAAELMVLARTTHFFW